MKKLYTITLNLWNKPFEVSSCNHYGITGRETIKGTCFYEFHISVYANSRYDAYKKAKTIVKESSWVKSQDTSSWRNI